MMFLEIPLYYILGAALILVLIVNIIVRVKAKRAGNSLEKSIDELKLMIIQVGFLLIILLLCLPSTSVLSTRYPLDVTSINSNEKILSYLQQYHRSITRTNEVVFWGLLFIIVGFLPTIWATIKAYKKHKKQF
ncbi:MAG: hypothetical protein WKI04_07275 [Ferruginibacter sp.]